MLIDCDTCTVRGHGCDDCVVTVLLGAPPGWRGSDPTVVPLSRRRPAAAAEVAQAGRVRAGSGDAVHGAVVDSAAVDGAAVDGAAVDGAAPGRADHTCDVARVDDSADDPWSVVELDEVEQDAVRALAEFGLVPPLRHQDASTHGSRHVS